MGHRVVPQTQTFREDPVAGTLNENISSSLNLVRARRLTFRHNIPEDSDLHSLPSQDHYNYLLKNSYLLYEIRRLSLNFSAPNTRHEFGTSHLGQHQP